MIEMRRALRSFGDGLISEETCDLWEDWMRHAVEILGDEQLVGRFAKPYPGATSRAAAGVDARRQQKRSSGF